MRKALTWLGIVFLAIGAILLSNSFSGMTGFVTVENVSDNISGIFGVAAVIAGIIILILRKPELKEQTDSAKKARTYLK